MQPETSNTDSDRRSTFIESLSAFGRQHRAQHWEGTFGDFLHNILPTSPVAFTRASHQYIWDMLRWYGRERTGDDDTARAQELFRPELFGIDEPLARVVDYFKAAAAGSDVGRRLLLLLGPPSGGKSTLAILLKRALEEYSRTDDGALYAIKGSPMHESPLNLVPASLRGPFRETYGVDINGELSPWARDRLEREYQGDYLRVPVERVFLSEAMRVGVGTYAPHDPTTADIADLVGSVDLSKVAEVGDEGDPRVWSWSGAVYAASRGMLEMIEILKVKREFLYLLLTLTQEKNVKVSRFPLIHLDETILAHTNLAEFNKFLQEKENEALLDRMVIIKVPYALSYKDESRIYQKLVSGAPAFRNVHLDPHVLNLVFFGTDDDLRHRLDHLRRMLARGGFGGQHHGVGSVHHRIRHVRDLGPGRYGIGDHRFHPRIALNGVLDCEQQFHTRQTMSITAGDGVREGIDDETRADTGQSLITTFRM